MRSKPRTEGARRAIFAWANRYNTRRLHSSLDNLTRQRWEQQYCQQHQADRAAQST